MTQGRRKLYAKPTQVTFTKTTVDRDIDRLWLRVELRAAELGIPLKEVARRMKIKAPRLNAICSQRTITRVGFERLSKALEMAPGGLLWHQPLLPVPRVSAEKMRRAVRRKLK